MKALTKTIFSLTTLLLAASAAGTGCVADTGDVPGDIDGKPEDDGKLVDGKADAWNYTNNPSRFQVDFNFKLAELPTNGAAAVTPWPDTYWPTYKDSTNQRWQGSDEMSPLEKYDMAFNGWVPEAGFMDLRPFNPSNCEAEWDAEYYEKLGPAASYMSKNKGNLKARDGKDGDGDGEIDECDGDSLDGVETWWGLCHAWVPAAILEKEPQRSVTYNGVEFDVGDIKALVITAYDRTNALMLGGRCNEKEVERDEQGRIIADHCRDTNAGAFHVVAANMLGIHHRSFAEDRTYDYEVWNQPFRDFEVLSNVPVSAEEAMAALGLNGETSYSFNENAVQFAKVRTRVRYITEPSQSSTEPLVPAVENNNAYTGTDTYEYILEMDADGNIVGGEWLNYSQTTHPDFLWLPIAARGGNPNVSLDLVHELLDLSTKDATEPNEGEIRTFESTNETSIPDNNAAGIADTITITEDVSIGSLKVAVNIDHSYIGDLKVVLEKDGVIVPLHNRVGGGSNDINATYDVSEFNGQSAKGTWTLKVSDHASWDKGKLESWSLQVSSNEPAPQSEFSATDTPLNIPDNNAAGISSTIAVAEEGALASVQIKVDLSHTYVGDLTLTLSHGGATQVLHSREGGSSDDINKTFSTDAFNGAQLSGDWTLSVKDLAGADVGSLNAWSVVGTLQ